MALRGSWLTLVGLALVATGCSGTATEPRDDGTTGPGDPPGTTRVLPDGTDVCDLLTSAQVRRLVGTPIRETRADPVRLDSCTWDGGTSTWVTLVVDTGEAWSEHLPEAYDVSVTAGVLDREQRARLGASARRLEGCDLFESLRRIKGVRGEVIVEPDPTALSHRVLTAKTCEDGRFISLTGVVASSDRPPASGDARAVLAAVLERIGESG